MGEMVDDGPAMGLVEQGCEAVRFLGLVAVVGVVRPARVVVERVGLAAVAPGLPGTDGGVVDMEADDAASGWSQGGGTAAAATAASTQLTGAHLRPQHVPGPSLVLFPHVRVRSCERAEDLIARTSESSPVLLWGARLLGMDVAPEILSLSIQRYKNLADVELPWLDGLALFGQNGAGKTNLLECLALLAGTDQTPLLAADRLDDPVGAALALTVRVGPDLLPFPPDLTVGRGISPVPDDMLQSLP